MRVCACLLCCASVALAGPVLVDRVVASVDGQLIFLSQVERRVASLKNPPKDARKVALAALIDVRLIEKDAGGRPTDAEVEQALDSIANDNGLDRAGLEAEAKRQGLTFSVYREAIRGQLLELRWLMRRANGAPLDTPEQRAALQERLLIELRKQAVIEVFE